MCGFIAILVSLLVTSRIRSEDLSELLSEHKVFYEDWTTKPFVDLLIIDQPDSCPDEYKPVIKRTWKGTTDVCVSSDTGEVKAAPVDGKCESGQQHVAGQPEI